MIPGPGPYRGDADWSELQLEVSREGGRSAEAERLLLAEQLGWLEPVYVHCYRPKMLAHIRDTRVHLRELSDAKFSLLCQHLPLMRALSHEYDMRYALPYMPLPVIEHGVKAQCSGGFVGIMIFLRQVHGEPQDGIRGEEIGYEGAMVGWRYRKWNAKRYEHGKAGEGERRYLLGRWGRGCPFLSFAEIEKKLEFEAKEPA